MKLCAVFTYFLTEYLSSARYFVYEIIECHRQRLKNVTEYTGLLIIYTG